MKFILYTLNEGGNFLYTQSDTDENTIKVFNQLKKEGFIALKRGDAEPIPQKLAFIILGEEEDNYDFQIKSKR
jgi:hypothetical protein